MILCKHFIGIIFVISLFCSVSPISAYSIETQNNFNSIMGFDKDVSASVDSMKILSTKNTSKEKELKSTTIGNNGIYKNPLRIPRIFEVLGMFISSMGTLVLLKGVNHLDAPICCGLTTPFKLGFILIIFGMLMSAISGN